MVGPHLGRQAGRSLSLGQSGLQREFQDNQGYRDPASHKKKDTVDKKTRKAVDISPKSGLAFGNTNSK